MGLGFRVHDLHRNRAPAERNDLGLYLFHIHDRLHNPIHAETRVYTCRSWAKSSHQTTPYELHWNAEAVPGEKFLGEFGWIVRQELVERIADEFARGQAVRLFIFNSDADLCFEEVLEPVRAD